MSLSPCLKPQEFVPSTEKVPSNVFIICDVLLLTKETDRTFSRKQFIAVNSSMTNMYSEEPVKNMKLLNDFFFKYRTELGFCTADKSAFIA